LAVVLAGGGGGRGMNSLAVVAGQLVLVSLQPMQSGINFGDTYDDGTQINGSYFFNKTSLFNTSNSFTQSLLGNINTTIVWKIL
jgi:hypothetical protein